MVFVNGKMAKDTSGSRFRKVDVDQYDEDKFQDDAVESVDQDEGPNESEINSHLMQKQLDAAVKLALVSAPAGSKNAAVRERAANIIFRVLTAFKPSEIEAVVKSLDQKLLDILMKYIYKGFETPNDGSSAILLAWHERVVAVGGLGTIVRVLADRKQI